jgi:hypothetical protein
MKAVHFLEKRRSRIFQRKRVLSQETNHNKVKRKTEEETNGDNE